MNLGQAIQFDSYQDADAQELLLSGRERHGGQGDPRLLMTEAIAAATFSVAALVLALLGSSPQPLDGGALAVSVACYLVAQRVRFPVGSAHTQPTVLVFVPMLVVLPTHLVPAIVAVCALVDRLPAALRGRFSLTRELAWLADCSFALGPALVLLAAGDERLTFTRPGVIVAAFAAQILVDGACGLGRSWFAERSPPRVQVPMLWLYLVDACLWCVALPIAAVSVQRPGLVALSLAPIGLLWMFARERRQRFDSVFALSDAYRAVAMLLGDIVEADDLYTGQHSRDVVEHALSIGVELGLDVARRRPLELAALLHDVGKINMPKEIVNKPSALDASELEVMRRHTIEGEQMLSPLGGTLTDVGRLVRASHERFDGGGYPDGLAGEQIPIEARIVAVCDAFSAMTSGRCYRAAMDAEQALAELRRCAGSQFDPRVVAAFERLHTSR